MKILYETAEGMLCVITPCPCDLTLEQIAQKDVPFGTPYLIVENSSLPEDWSTRDAWQADFSNHDGIGLGPQRFFIQRAQVEIDQGIDIEKNVAIIEMLKAEILKLEGVTL